VKKVYKILFVCALSPELKIVKQEIKKLDISKNLEISFFVSGFWNYETIYNLTTFLSRNTFDFVVNIWVCWYTSEKSDLVQITRIFNLSNKKELISPIFVDFAKIESIFCSEEIVYSPISLHLGETEWVVFVDMESFWFEFVLAKFAIPRMILKVPVDKIWEETKDFDYKKALEMLWNNIAYKKLILEIESYLKNTSLQPSPLEERGQGIKDKIKNYFRLTFSEKIILEKLLNKIIVLKLVDLESFFEENKALQKKEFLEKLKDISW